MINHKIMAYKSADAARALLLDMATHLATVSFGILDDKTRLGMLQSTTKKVAMAQELQNWLDAHQDWK